MKKKTSISVGLITFAVLTVLLAAAPIKQLVSNAQTSIRTAGLPNRNCYALTSDNAIYVLTPTLTQYTRLGRASTDGGNLIGIDFRVADGTPNTFYGLTDTGRIYKITVTATGIAGSTLVSTMNPRFTGGLGVLVDFNPVANALRVAGLNNQNIAVVNANGGNLNMTVAQAPFTYAAGDPNAGRDPEITGGAYDSNRNGAAATTFYLMDSDLDTLVTTATRVAAGSSNTGAGVLKTIGRIVDGAGNRLNMSPTTDFDIVTRADGVQFLVGQTTRLLFTINLARVNPDLPVGTTQSVVVSRGAAGIQLPAGDPRLSGGVFDIACVPFY